MTEPDLQHDGSTQPEPKPDRRRWFEAGFFAMLGAIVVSTLAIASWHVFTAALDVATPIIVGLILAIMLDPLVDRLMRRGLTRAGAVSVVFLGGVLIVGGICAVAVPALINQATQLADNAPAYVGHVQDYINDFLARHRHIGKYRMPQNVDALLGQVSGKVSGYIQTAAGSIASYLVGSVVMVLQTIVTLIVTFYLLLDIDRLRARLLFLTPDRIRPTMEKMAGDIGGVFGEYVRGLLTVCALYGLFTTIYLYCLSIAHHDLAKYALLVGAVAGVLYAVPYVGALATALITFVVAFAAGGNGGLPFAGLAIVLLLVLNQVFDNIVTPRVVGGSVGLHPVMAIFALLLGAELFGIWGMVLSVPVAASIQVILFRFFPTLKQPTPDRYLRLRGVPKSDATMATVDPSKPESANIT